MPERTPGAAADRMAGGGAPIAIIGAACRLPGAPDLAAFARLLEAGTDAVTEVPAGRFSQPRFLHPRLGEIGRAPHFRAGVIGDVAGFDAPAFGISPREAEEMDPQQRLLLVLARRAFEDAGWPEDQVAGQPFGVYVGGSTTDYGNLRQEDTGSADRYMMTGSALSILSNRIGNVFDLRGPAMTLDTACSSAMVALHEACEALRHGRVPAALVGGVNLLLAPFPFGGFWRAGMLSLRGRCQAFGAGADGYVRAEGGVVLVLKPLAAALADGDAVRGVILASGVNGAGRTNGISLPDGAAQAALISAVLRAGRVKPAGLGYFEAHGTGTPAGDPIEAAAIGQALRGRRAPLPIGSVKSNIGHTEAAAGLVGVLKALLVLETGRIPPTLHCETPNPNIPFAALGLAPATRAMPLEGEAVAVNSFGFGGTNACALLGPAPATRPANGRAPDAAPPLLLSAQSPGALQRLAADWAPLLAKAPPEQAAALLRGQARHRMLRPHRLVARGPRLARALAAFGRGEEVPDLATGLAARGEGVGFLFTGNGAAWARMATAEMRGSAEFRAGIERADAALSPQLGWSVAEVLERGVTASEIARTDIAQPLLFAMQHAIVAALAAQGITPAFCLGHSVGEVAAAEAAGMLSLRQAARLIAARSRHQHARRGVGRMAVLGATPEDAAPVLAECSAGEDWPLSIAAVNAAASLTVAGPAAALARLGQAAASRRWSWLALDLDYAFHSAAMDPVRADLLRDLRGLRGREGSVPLVSTVTGQVLDPAECDAGYWWRNLRAPVRFADALATALSLGPALLLEIGPKPLLQGYVRTGLRAAGRDLPSLATLRPHRARTADPFPALADAATAQGADPRGGPAFAGPGEFRALPPLPLEPAPHWAPRSVEARGLVHAGQDGPLLGFREGEEWRLTLDTLAAPWLADHALGPQAVLPAAAMVEMALEAGFLRHPAASWLEVQDFVILRPVPLVADALRDLRIRLDEEGGFRLETRRRLGPEAWSLHATAHLAALPPPPEPAAPDELAEPWQEGAALTRIAAGLGLDYGPAFRPVTRFAACTRTGQVRLELDRPPTAPPDEPFHLHPVRLDGALQGLLGLLAQPCPAREGFLPVRFGRVLARRGGAVAVAAEVALTAPGERSAAADITLRDALGRAVARLEDATFQRFPLGERAAAPPLFQGEWVAAAVPLGWPEPAPALDPQVLAPPAAGAALDEAALLLAAHAAASAAEAGLATAQGPLAEALRLHLGPPATDLPAPQAIWQQVMLDQPCLAQELATLAEAAEALPAALLGLPCPPARLPADAESLRHLAAALAQGAAQLLAFWPAERPCRVLLAGATDGPLLPALTQALGGLRPPTLQLVVTHLPGSRPPPVPEGVGLAEWDPLGAETPPGEADLVLGLALSPRRAGGQALAEGLRRATAPGGALLLAEPLPGLFWDMTEGLAAEWWTAPRLLDAAGWTTALRGADWDRPRVLPLPPLPWPAALVAAAMPASGQLLPAAMGRHFALWAGPTQGEWASALADALAATGARVTRLPADPAPAALRGATLLALPDATPEGLAATAQLASAAEGAAEALHIVTRGGAEHPGAAALAALGRVLANEMPGLRPHRHDLDPGLDPQGGARRLAAALLTPPDQEAEQRLTARGRLVPRVRAGLPAPPPPPGPVRLEVRLPGQLGSLAWQAAPDLLAHALAPGEVRLAVAAVGLNFRDVMWAQGLLPEETLRPGFAGPGLGMEVAGVVEAVGPGCTLAPGQAVLGVAPRALASRAITREEALVPRPDWLSPQDAAALPVAFMTAVHALEELGRVGPGERVLIHGGAGAVGLAALQVALAAGARVAATAGTEARRALLRAAGAEIALDSRAGGFAEELRAHWPAPPGEGCVDLCLNSLSGEAMERSLALMAPFGRFLELGKRDYAEARRVALRPMRRNVSYFAVDVDELARARPAIARRHLEGIMRRLEEGIFRPLPVRVHDAATVEDAFRRLQAGGHIGKLVIQPPAETPEGAARPRWDASALADGWVVVVGGTAGFGLEAACWLAGQGARRLALLSRRGAEAPGAEAARARLQALGARAEFLACDATDEAALAAALDGLRAAAPLLGVVQAAAVLSDGVAARLDARAARAVWAAKVTVAEHLDRLTADDPLGLFVLFSSATVPIGSPGQAAYVAANAGMEGLARRRHRQGRPALAIQWGPISDAGMLAGAEGRAEGLARRLGAVSLTAREALDRLPALLASGVPVAGVARLDWPAARRSLALLAEPPFAALAGQGAAETADEEVSLPMLRALPPDGAREVIQRMVCVEVGRILRLPAHSITLDAPLARLGLDSLGGLELRTALERRFSLSLPMQGVGEALTAQSVTQLLLDGLNPGREAAE